MLLTSNCSEVAEIAGVTQRLGQFQQLLKTPVILILNFTRPHAITYTYISEVKSSNSSSNRETYYAGYYVHKNTQKTIIIIL